MMMKGSADEIERKSGIAVDQLKGDMKDALLNEARALRAAGITEDQLKTVFRYTLRMKVNSGPHKHTTSTTCSSSNTRLIMEDKETASYRLPSAEDLDDLRYIAQRINSIGCLEKYNGVYTSDRKATMNADFKRTGIEKTSNIEVQRLGLEPLRLKTMRWIRAAKIGLQVLIPREKQLSEHIFKGLGNGTDESRLTETVRDPAAQVLDFAEALSSCRRPPERLKSILLLHRGLCARLPDINSAFPSELAKSINVRASSILPRLVEKMRLILLDFEGARVHLRQTGSFLRKLS